MKILFIGDSITDGGRNTKSGVDNDLGQGYPFIIAGKLGAENPGRYEFVNTGISGNRIVDNYARIKCDVWNHKPDVISILIGVNDVWHEVVCQNGVDNRRFENVYRMMIDDTLRELPDAKIVIMEPFVLKGSATEEAWEYFDTETRLRAQASERVAKEFGCVFVPLQAMLDDAAAKLSVEYWVHDGAHPTAAGHQLIADAWLKATEGIL